MIYHTASHCTVCITTDVVKSCREQCSLGWANQQIVDTMYSDRGVFTLIVHKLKLLQMYDRDMASNKWHSLYVFSLRQDVYMYMVSKMFTCIWFLQHN